MFFLGGERYLLGGAAADRRERLASACRWCSTTPSCRRSPTPDERDAVSSRGWAFGYAAGALVLVANLVLFAGTTPSASPRATAVRICLASAGLWWGAFTLVPLRRLRERRPAATGPRRGGAALGQGWRQLRGDRCATCAATR